MLDTFRYTLLWLVRSPGIIIWSLLFPLILTSVFMLMFAPLDDIATIEPIRVVAVEPDDSTDGRAFTTFLDAISEGDEPLFDLVYASDAEEAARMVTESAGADDAFIGYVELDDGTPRAHVIGNVSLSGTEGMESSILTLAMDEYTAKRQLVIQLMEENPSAFDDPQAAASLFAPVQATVQVQVTENQPKESVRYYFALLGMAALFGGGVGLAACQRLRANTSALGARRSVSAVSHGRAVGGTLLASWLLSFVCLAIAYCYMRLLGTVDFAGRDGACLLTVGVASLLATALGCAISAIPRVPDNGKDGLLTAIVCFASLFAGLYGQPTMAFADRINADFPIVSWLNPADQVAQAFYSIMYYNDYGPLLMHLAALLIMTVVLFLISARALRRQRYASI